MYTVYLLHFNSPYWNNGRGECQHYIGYTSLSLEERIARHRAGSGSKLVKYALEHNNDFTAACLGKFATREEARQEELRLKHNGHQKNLCRVCKDEISKKVSVQKQYSLSSSTT